MPSTTKNKEHTAEPPTLAKIRRLAERRQALWSKAPGLTATDRAEISRLTAALEALWEQHRLALAKPRVFPGRGRAGAATARKNSAA